MKINKKYFVMSAVTCSLMACTSLPETISYTFSADPKAATNHTKTENTAFKDTLNFSEVSDFENARKGWIARDETLVVCSHSNPACDETTAVWEIESYKGFIEPLDTAASPGSYPDIYDTADDSPESVNPSLWRNAKLNMHYGLFAVLDEGTVGTADKGDIFQVRNYDLSNITFVKGDTGWIVLDPLISPETAAKALTLINNNIESDSDQVSAVIYSHSHTDHYGGINGLDFVEAKPKIYAPESFTEHAVSENVIAGNAMGRRAVYMYGSLLQREVRGSVNAGLGMTTSTGVPGLKVPTSSVTEETELSTESCTIDEPGCAWDIDGVAMQFQMTPGTEAPAEMNTWLPDQNALWMAENTTNTMHNILTLRGAKVRDALKWAKYLTSTIDRYGEKAEVKFQSHHWPVWGQADIKDYLTKQRDVYKYMHDQTVRWMNEGYNGEEISEAIELPTSLKQNWPTRGYYGTLRHNTRAIYQYYMGWYNANPSDLNNLPALESAIRYVHYMGGVESVLTKAVAEYRLGEYRWVAEVLKQVVFAQSDCENGWDLNRPVAYPKDCAIEPTQARYLLADAYEQLAYQAESGPWRSVYLQGASELRVAIDPDAGALETASPETIQAMPVDMLFDYWSVRINAEEIANLSRTFAVEFADIKANEALCNDEIAVEAENDSACTYYLTLNNSVLNYSTVKPADFDSYVDENGNKNESVYVKKSTLDYISSLPEEELETSKFTYATRAEVDDIAVCGSESNCIYSSYGNTDAIDDFVSYLETYNFWFNIVTPNKPIAIQ